MARPPKCAPSVARMPGVVYSPIAKRLDAQAAGPVPLHVGDTWMEPFAGGRMEDLHVVHHPGMHRYSETEGIRELIDAIVEKLRARNIGFLEDCVALAPGSSSGAEYEGWVRICYTSAPPEPVLGAPDRLAQRLR